MGSPVTGSITSEKKYTTKHGTVSALFQYRFSAFLDRLFDEIRWLSVSLGGRFYQPVVVIFGKGDVYAFEMASRFGAFGFGKRIIAELFSLGGGF